MRNTWPTRPSSVGVVPIPIHAGYVVFGLDQHGRPRAAWFSPSERQLADLASNLAGLSSFEPSWSARVAPGLWLPRGGRLESGRFVIPRVRRGLYQKLLELEERAERTRLMALPAGSNFKNDADQETDANAADIAEALDTLAAILQPQRDDSDQD